MKKKPGKYSAELKDRAVRMVKEMALETGSEWSAIEAIAPKLGCSVETLRRWIRDLDSKHEVPRPVAKPSEEQQRIKELERENRQLRQANDILRLASAYFAQAELDRRFP